MLQKTTTLLNDAPQLIEKQNTDAALGVVRRESLEEKRRPDGGVCLVDDGDLLGAILSKASQIRRGLRDGYSGHGTADRSW